MNRRAKVVERTKHGLVWNRQNRKMHTNIFWLKQVKNFLMNLDPTLIALTASSLVLRLTKAHFEPSTEVPTLTVDIVKFRSMQYMLLAAVTSNWRKYSRTLNAGCTSLRFPTGFLADRTVCRRKEPSAPLTLREPTVPWGLKSAWMSASVKDGGSSPTNTAVS